MVQEGKKTYPWISAKAWWDLRRRFLNSPPAKVDAGYIQTVLKTDTSDAARSIVRNLKAVGLVDDTNSRTSRALDWRDDGHYAEVCKQILDEVYSQSLLDALPPPNPDRDAAERWFSRETGLGRAAVKKMAAFYLLLCEADPNAAGKAADRSTRSDSTDRPRRRRNGRTPEAQQLTESTDGKVDTLPIPAPVPSGREPAGPLLHMDIHIHMDAGLSLEQIDQVFASMSKHLYGGPIAR